MQPTQSPAQLRNMFGSNLRQLSSRYDSISELSRQLGINRTQFNRYLSGESFPRPDVLARMCAFFHVDARILLEPVDELGSIEGPATNPVLRDYLGLGTHAVPEDLFPNGFYRFSRRSFLHNESFLIGLVFVWREGPNTFLRGYENRDAIATQGLPSQAAIREFRAIVMQQEDGLAILASRRNAMTCSFNYLARVGSFDNNFWLGYVTRTVPETVSGLRATRLVYEHIKPEFSEVMAAARGTGFHTEEQLPPFHRRLLRAEVAFT